MFVEFALILPVLAVLVLGIFDFGFLHRQSSLVQTGAQQAARTAAGSGTWRFADFEALRAIDSSMSTASRVEIDRVIIWRTDDPDGAVPQTCLDIAVSDGDTSPKGSAAAHCNVYSGAQVAATSPATGFSADPDADDCADGASWDWFWCPVDRVSSTTGGAGSADFVGVYLEATYEPLTGIITTDEYTVEREAVYRIEPCVPGVSQGECPT
jgi:hypothetical protein